jgi:alkanesulfonate monooxygenase SsuD/methylene tetrahydromethanopterin reductase-like flavin-dependent oxidoreductase (luciferase family)
MTFSHRPFRSGVSVPIFASPGHIAFRTPAYSQLDVRQTLDYAILADDLGYDSLWVADHLQLGKGGAILEGWTTLAALAGATKRAALGTIHLSNVFRHPPHVAKMAATVDQISGGRLIFFFDAGWNSGESEAYGFEFVDALTRVARMREALDVVRRLWTESGPIDHAGAHYNLRGAICEPKPVQKPHPPIWIGEAGHDGLVDAAAEVGQGWNSVPVSPAEYTAKLARLEVACRRSKRDMADLELSLESQILIAPTHREVDRIVDRIESLRQGEIERASAAGLVGESALARPVSAVVAEQRQRWLMGTPDDVIDQIRVFRSLGVSHLLLWFLDAPEPAGLRLYAAKVKPVLA